MEGLGLGLRVDRVQCLAWGLKGGQSQQQDLGV